MVQENELLPEMHRIGRQELELDTDEQAAILEQTENDIREVSATSPARACRSFDCLQGSDAITLLINILNEFTVR